MLLAHAPIRQFTLNPGGNYAINCLRDSIPTKKKRPETQPSGKAILRYKYLFLIARTVNNYICNHMPEPILNELSNTVQQCLACISNQNKGEPNIDKADLDFWLDPKSVIFMTSPETEEIYCAKLDDLETKSDLLEIILDKAIISTFLTTEDLILVLAAQDSPNLYDVRMAAIDRSTGCALIRTENLFNKDILERNILKTIGDSTEPSKHFWLHRYSDNKSWQFRKVAYKRISYPGNNFHKRFISNSYRRLQSFVLDIETHILAKFNEVEIQEDENSEP